MCGRFTHRLSWREIHDLYRLTAPAAAPNLEPRYNVCPTDTISVVIERDGGRELVPMRWGLIPRWWKKSLKELPATFNARAESVAEKPMFRDAFKGSRCLVPISGYYEWVAAPDGKQPFYFTRSDGAPIPVAGLWDEWKSPESGDPLNPARWSSRPRTTASTTACRRSLSRRASRPGSRAKPGPSS
jgi:putative SOS response-associated peptidase YedK